MTNCWNRVEANPYFINFVHSSREYAAIFTTITHGGETCNLMTKMPSEIRDGLNLALNEAIIIGLDFDEHQQIVYVTFYPIAIQQDGKIPNDNRFLFAFRNVGRLASSLTPEPDLTAVKFEPGELGDKMSEFKNESIYGWEFIGNAEEISFKQWKDNVSFDIIINDDYFNQNTIDLCQQCKYSTKVIDIRIWFENIAVFDSDLKPFDIPTFIDNGKRGWNKLYESGWSVTETELKGKLKINA